MGIGVLHQCADHDRGAASVWRLIPESREHDAAPLDRVGVGLSIAAIASVLSPRIVERVGTTNVVRTGLALLSAAFVWIAFRVEVDTSYLEIVGQMIFLGGGLGATTAPATTAWSDS